MRRHVGSKIDVPGDDSTEYGVGPDAPGPKTSLHEHLHDNGERAGPQDPLDLRLVGVGLSDCCLVEPDAEASADSDGFAAKRPHAGT